MSAARLCIQHTNRNPAPNHRAEAARLRSTALAPYGRQGEASQHVTAPTPPPPPSAVDSANHYLAS